MNGAQGASPTSPRRLIEMIEGGGEFTETCPVHEMMKHVTSRWGVLILIVLRRGIYRFSDLRRRINGVSEKMLAQTLQWLESDGFVQRRSFPVTPPHVEYSLTPHGEEVARMVEQLADWLGDARAEGCPGAS